MITDLATTFASGGNVLFCGAGVSRDPPAGLPDWHELRDSTVEAIAGRAPGLSEFARLLTAMEMIADPTKRGLTPEVVASTIERQTAGYFESLAVLREGGPNANHVAVASLAAQGFVSSIVTTNFDLFIERALEAAGVEFRSHRTKVEFEEFLEETTRSTGVDLFKLHGCLSVPTTITATVEQQAVGLPPARAAVMESLLRSGPLVVWGYSGADLKIDLDYLRMVRSAEAAVGFVWNLHETDDDRESPSAAVRRLADLYGAKCRVGANLVPDALRELGLLDADAVDPGESSHATALCNERLRLNLREWSDANIDAVEAASIIGTLLQDSGFVDEAERCYELMARAAEDRDEPSRLGWALNNLGIVRHLRGDLSGALELFAKARDLAEDDHARQIVLANESGVHADRGDHATALRQLDEIRQIAIRHDDRRSWARAESRRGTSLKETGRYEDAIAACRSAEEVLAALGEQGDLIECQRNRATAHRAIGELDDARTAFTEALERAKALGLKSMVARLEVDLARIASHDGEFDAARRLLEEALDLAPEALAPELRATIMNDLAAVLMMLDEPAIAHEHLIQAESLLRDLDAYPLLLAGVLKSRADVIERLGDEQELARRLRAEAFGRFEELGQFAYAANTAREQGRALARVPDQRDQSAAWYRIALSYAFVERLEQEPEAIWRELEQCLLGRVRTLPEILDEISAVDADIAETLEAVIGDPAETTAADALSNVTVAAQRAAQLGDPPTAIQLWRACATLADASGIWNYVAGALNELGMIASRQGDPRTAARHYEEAATLSRSIRDWRQLAMCGHNRGQLALADDDADAAVAQLEEATKAARRANDDEVLLPTLLSFAEALNQHGSSERAGPVAREAIDLASRLDDPARFARGCQLIGKALFELGEHRHSAAWREQAVASLTAQGRHREALVMTAQLAMQYGERIGERERARELIEQARHEAPSTAPDLMPVLAEFAARLGSDGTAG